MDPAFIVPEQGGKIAGNTVQLHEGCMPLSEEARLGLRCGLYERSAHRLCSTSEGAAQRLVHGRELLVEDMTFGMGEDTSDPCYTRRAQKIYYDSYCWDSVSRRTQGEIGPFVIGPTVTGCEIVQTFTWPMKDSLIPCYECP